MRFCNQDSRTVGCKGGHATVDVQNGNRQLSVGNWGSVILDLQLGCATEVCIWVSATGKFREGRLAVAVGWKGRATALGSWTSSSLQQAVSK